MKYLFFLLTIITTTAFGQSLLKFDHRFVESENKWVAIRTSKDSVLNFGFIYIDAFAGLTLNYEGSFTISNDGTFIPKRLENVGMKYRLEPNNVKVAFIPSSKFVELGITEYPDWLKIYLGDTTSIDHLYRWGFLYNGYGECAKALTYLERAHAKNPTFKGLAVEISFSYNCLKQYDKAEAILKEEIKTNPTDAYVNKEYIYTLINNNKIDQAINQFETSSKDLIDKKYNAENCYNILHYYYSQKDKTNFSKWYKILQQQPNENKQLTQNADIMKADINK